MMYYSLDASRGLLRCCFPGETLSFSLSYVENPPKKLNAIIRVLLVIYKKIIIPNTKYLNDFHSENLLILPKAVLAVNFKITKLNLSLPC